MVFFRLSFENDDQALKQPNGVETTKLANGSLKGDGDSKYTFG